MNKIGRPTRKKISCYVCARSGVMRSKKITSPNGIVSWQNVFEKPWRAAFGADFMLVPVCSAACQRKHVANVQKSLFVKETS